MATATNVQKLIESDEFQIEFLSELAMRESWRKEVYRPIYHLHKWWAKRLGSIFRGIILGCLLPQETTLEDAFYEQHCFANMTIFDPFMGSGTTIGEGHKLGCTVLGRDINPVACESVRVALGKLDRLDIESAYDQLTMTVGQRIQKLYQITDDYGRPSDVLYFFWVKQVACPTCHTAVDLFSTYIIARNAYPDKKPEVQIYCPGCGAIFPALNSTSLVTCPACNLQFDPQHGPAQRAKVTCRNCAQQFAIVTAMRLNHQAPNHRLYAKLVLTVDGDKRYLPATAADHQAYQFCCETLQQEVTCGTIRLPETSLTDGFNTRQAINYQYRQWRDFFNQRQLLALGWLNQAIIKLTDEPSRDVLLTLFSGVLEFNNLFASYKGEGTGAVRHMFSHHILKPERTPIEANVWGTSKSSGSFSNLYRSRITRALDYRSAPFEVSTGGNGKRFHGSPPFTGNVDVEWPVNGHYLPKQIYLSLGSSDHTDLPTASVDFIVTDPPFFDNVHYSELADFFFAWQSLYPHGFIHPGPTTRHVKEVQDGDAQAFTGKLQAVFAESHRILKVEGLLVFTYHHSRTEGWTTLISALWDAGFSVVNAHPVKAELSIAVPKSQAKEPIQLDIILVCRKRIRDQRPLLTATTALQQAETKTRQKMVRLQAVGLTLSENDLHIMLISQFISAMGPISVSSNAVARLASQQTALKQLAGTLLNDKGNQPSGQQPPVEPKQAQLTFQFSTE